MRVLFLNERDLSHPLAGGVEVHLEEMASRLASQCGIEPTVLCASFPGAAREEKRRGIRYIRFGNRLSYYAMLPHRARALVKNEHFDVVIEELCKVIVCSGLWLRGVPKLALSHHLFGLSAFMQVAPPIAAWVLASETMLPLLYRRWPFVAVSPSSRDDLIKRGLPGERIRVVPNGLDHRLYAPGDRAQHERNTVLFVGRLEHYKGADVLLDAWAGVRAKRPDARLILVGSGSAEGKLRAQAARLGNGVTFAGFIPDEEKRDLMRRARLLVQPSFKEGWGLTVLEANACGTPVVATRVPGLRDSVRDGETGLLVPPGNSTALAQGILRLLDDDTLHARLATAALRWSAHFTWEAVTASFAEILRAVAAGKPLPETPDYLQPDALGTPPLLAGEAR